MTGLTTPRRRIKESPMEHVLLKLAKQLNAFDEASLMSLWEKYAETVQRFEPTKRWEEAALVFGFIQSLRWKNQLFNYNWAQNSKPREDGPRLANPFGDPSVDALAAPSQAGAQDKGKPGLRQKIQSAQKTKNAQKTGKKVLRFKPRDNGVTKAEEPSES
jgi:hypothetical protein